MANKIYQKVAERDNHECRICGNNQIQIHHIIFRSHGGKNTKENLITLCKHHHDKAHKNEREWRTRLLDMQSELYGTREESALKLKNKWER